MLCSKTNQPFIPKPLLQLYSLSMTSFNLCTPDFLLALSKAKQLSWHNFSRKDDRTKSLVFADRKERGSMMDKAETTSLMDLRMESTLEVEKLPSNVISASTGDIHETESGRLFVYLIFDLFLCPNFGVDLFIRNFLFWTSPLVGKDSIKSLP